MVSLLVVVAFARSGDGCTLGASLDGSRDPATCSVGGTSPACWRGTWCTPRRRTSAASRGRPGACTRRVGGCTPSSRSCSARSRRASDGAVGGAPARLAAPQLVAAAPDVERLLAAPLEPPELSVPGASEPAPATEAHLVADARHAHAEPLGDLPRLGR